MKKWCPWVCMLAAAAFLSAFDWPQENVTALSFSSGFAQLRGNMLSGSLIFSIPAEVRAADQGVVLAVIREPDDGSEGFYSPLGNAVIIDHNDDLLTVYGNLQTVSLIPETMTIGAGGGIGVSGSSGWQTGQTGLELQVVDEKNEHLINPLVLMPRFGDERPPRLLAMAASNRQGETYRLADSSSFPAGVYILYHDFDQTALPYRVTVSLNGTDVETIAYDMMAERGGRLSVRGKKYYTQEEIYPDARRMMLSEVTLLPGRNTIRVGAFNRNGLGTDLTYVVNNY